MIQEYWCFDANCENANCVKRNKESLRWSSKPSLLFVSVTRHETRHVYPYDALNSALPLFLFARRICDLNKNYGLCASYPSLLVVPASVTDAEIEAVAQFRSEQRLPVLCWGRKADSASIWRSSQPKVTRVLIVI